MPGAPVRAALQTFVTERPAEVLGGARAGQPVLFAPRVWGALTSGQRADPRALEVRYVFAPGDLAAIAALARECPWRAIPSSRAATATARGNSVVGAGSAARIQEPHGALGPGPDSLDAA